MLGLYVSGHPLDKFKDKLDMIKIKIGEAKKLPNNMPVVVMGMIEEVKKIMTKKNEQMAFLKLSDYNDSIELVAFPSILAKYDKMLYEGNCVGIKGKISVRNEDHSILCDEIKEPTASNQNT